MKRFRRSAGKQTNRQSKFLYREKISFINGSKRKAFLDKQKLREFSKTRPHSRKCHRVFFRLKVSGPNGGSEMQPRMTDKDRQGAFQELAGSFFWLEPNIHEGESESTRLKDM